VGAWELGLGPDEDGHLARCDAVRDPGLEPGGDGGLIANERGQKPQLPHAEVLRFVTSTITVPIVTTPRSSSVARTCSAIRPPPRMWLDRNTCLTN